MVVNDTVSEETKYIMQISLKCKEIQVESKRYKQGEILKKHPCYLESNFAREEITKNNCKKKKETKNLKAGICYMKTDLRFQETRD